jgi:polar amino acid transport system substrate-binding protein
LTCTGTIAALGLALTLVSGEPVRFATEAPFPPYTFIDETGQITGFERDVADEVCARAHLTCVWQNVQFDRLLPGVMSGEFDVILGGFAVTPARKQQVDFSISYNESSDVDVLYGREGAPEPAQARVGVQSGTIQEGHARAQGWDVMSYGSPQAVIDALQANAVDLAFGALSEAVENLPDILPLYSEEVPDMGTAMAVCKGNTALLTQLNAALDAMLQDGTIDEITARWL